MRLVDEMGGLKLDPTSFEGKRILRLMAIKHEYEQYYKMEFGFSFDLYYRDISRMFHYHKWFQS